MSWNDLPANERNQLAERLTERQLLIYVLRLGGGSWGYIAQLTSLQIRTVREHHRAAKITHDQIRRKAAA